MAILTGDIQWRPTIVRGLVDLDTVVGQSQLDHFRMAILTGTPQWRGTILVGQVDLDTVVGQ